MLAPLEPVAILLTVTLPPSVNVPVPIIEEPAVAPHSKIVLAGELSAKVDKLSIVPAFTVNVPETVVAAGNVFVPLPLNVKLFTVADIPVMLWEAPLNS